MYEWKGPDYRAFFEGGSPEENYEELLSDVERAAERLDMECVRHIGFPFPEDGKGSYTALFEGGEGWIALSYIDLGYHHYEFESGGDVEVRDVLSEEVGHDLRRTGLIGPVRDRIEAGKELYQSVVAGV